MEVTMIVTSTNWWGRWGWFVSLSFTVVGEIVDLWVMEVALELGLLQ
jgi:hypothetical protein